MAEARHSPANMRDLDITDAYAKANNIVDRIVAENGVYLPGQSGVGTGSMDHLDNRRLRLPAPPHRSHRRFTTNRCLQGSHLTL
jgi:hypothetical protein